MASSIYFLSPSRLAVVPTPLDPCKPVSPPSPTVSNLFGSSSLSVYPSSCWLRATSFAYFAFLWFSRNSSSSSSTCLILSICWLSWIFSSIAFMNSSFCDKASKVSLIFLSRMRFGYLLSSLSTSLRPSCSVSYFQIPYYLMMSKKSDDFIIFRVFFLSPFLTSCWKITESKNSSAVWSASISIIINSSMQ